MIFSRRNEEENLSVVSKLTFIITLPGYPTFSSTLILTSIARVHASPRGGLSCFPQLCKYLRVQALLALIKMNDLEISVIRTRVCFSRHRQFASRFGFSLRRKFPSNILKDALLGDLFYRASRKTLKNTLQEYKV